MILSRKCGWVMGLTLAMSSGYSVDFFRSRRKSPVLRDSGKMPCVREALVMTSRSDKASPVIALMKHEGKTLSSYDVTLRELSMPTKSASDISKWRSRFSVVRVLLDLQYFSLKPRMVALHWSMECATVGSSSGLMQCLIVLKSVLLLLAASLIILVQ